MKLEQHFAAFCCTFDSAALGDRSPLPGGNWGQLIAVPPHQDFLIPIVVNSTDGGAILPSTP